MNVIDFKEEDPMNKIVEAFANEQLKTEIPAFNVGDTIRVHNRIKEGSRERIQMFEGTVIARKGAGISETFTVRKLSSGVGVERIFPVHSPKIAAIAVVKRGKVRRAKLNFLRNLVGQYRIKERRAK